jgi:hypothetical protein
MSHTVVMDPPPMTARLIRPLLGSFVTVHTATRTLRGTLLSCVQRSAWLVVDDTDVVVRLDDIVAIRA